MTVNLLTLMGNRDLALTTGFRMMSDDAPEEIDEIYTRESASQYSVIVAGGGSLKYAPKKEMTEGDGQWE